VFTSPSSGSLRPRFRRLGPRLPSSQAPLGDGLLQDGDLIDGQPRLLTDDAVLLDLLIGAPSDARFDDPVMLRVKQEI
jgi:hypothetical protein